MNSKQKTSIAKHEIGSAPADRARNAEACGTLPDVQKTRVPVPKDEASGAVMMRDVGAKDKDFFHGYMRHMWEAHWRGGEVDDMDFRFVISFVEDLKPRNQLAAALALQLAITHLYTMRFAQRLSTATDIPGIEFYERLYTKMTRSFVTQLEAYKAYNNNEVGITVQNFSVKDVNQAIVGNITHNGRGGEPVMTAAPLPATTGASLTPMQRERQPERVRIEKRDE